MPHHPVAVDQRKRGVVLTVPRQAATCLRKCPGAGGGRCFVLYGKYNFLIERGSVFWEHPKSLVRVRRRCVLDVVFSFFL
jgi:hypothetical protein